MELVSIQKKEKLPEVRHLKEGVRGIIACIGTRDQFVEGKGPEREVFLDLSENVPNAHNVDFHEEPYYLKKRGFKNNTERSYVISSIDELDKFSERFFDCTGLVVTGQDKDTGLNISFISHQDPEYIFGSENHRNSFTADLLERLAEIKRRSVEGTIDAVIVGGNYRKHKDDSKRLYLESINLLAKETLKVLGFEPIVMTGPKTDVGQDDIFYSNKDRRLFIVRPEVGNDSTESFIPSSIEDQEKKW